MTYPIIQRELTVHVNNDNWYLRPIEEKDILGPADYAWHRYNLYPDSFTFGEGLLAGSMIPGSRRLVFGSWSPQWDGFFLSSLGGAAHTFHGVGVNYVALRGRASQPSALLLNHKSGEVKVRLDPISVEVLWAAYANPEGEPLSGFHALQQALFDRYADEYDGKKIRICTVGPAAKYTREGAIGSSPIRNGKLSPVIDWAGRGGLGSRLLQYHNIAAIIFGGGWEDPDLRDSAEIDVYFLEHFGKKTIQTDLALTEKYRYVPQFETGGTFGVNMRDLNERILSFNYTSIYTSDESRLRQHENFILNHYLKQFNEETIAPKHQRTCGEPCSALCKKMRDQYKKDYEPYQAMGPLCGVFDQRAAERLCHQADLLGFDAISVGGVLAWMMELLVEGLLTPADLGVSGVPSWKADGFDPVADSARNAAIGLELLQSIIERRGKVDLADGARKWGRRLSRETGKRLLDRFLYVAFGRQGWMVPNQYWTPGVLAPMGVMGKYYMYYGNAFAPPRTLGRMCAERMEKELAIDTAGFCRFHRGWAEELIPEIFGNLYGLKDELLAGIRVTASRINSRNASVYWESERNVDFLHTYLRRIRDVEGETDPQLVDWLDRFDKDKNEAALDWWFEMRKGIDESLREF